MKIYRNGPLGALMDEYERVAGELVALIEGISGEEYEVVRDPAWMRTRDFWATLAEPVGTERANISIAVP